MSHPLVEKFRAVVIKHHNRLPPEDLAFCRDQEKKLHEVIEQLGYWKTLFEEYVKANPNPAFDLHKVDTSYRRSDYDGPLHEVTEKYKYLRGDDGIAEGSSYYDRFKFTPLFSIVNLEGRDRKAIQFFVDAIYDYFRQKYTIKVVSPKVFMHPTVNWKDHREVIEFLRLQLGGTLDFRAVATEAAIERFKGILGWMSRVEIKGKQLLMENYMTYNHTNERPYEGKYLEGLNTVISLFERKELEPSFMFQELLEYISFDRDYDVPGGTRLVGVRFFKKGKVILKFSDATGPKDFYNQFELSSLRS